MARHLLLKILAVPLIAVAATAAQARPDVFIGVDIPGPPVFVAPPPVVLPAPPWVGRADFDRDRDWRRDAWERREWERREWQRREWERREWQRREWERNHHERGPLGERGWD